MAVKPVQDKTKRYSGVVKSVQKTQPAEEPRITQEQVTRAFESFGFTPNERNHNDIAYWTMKGQSEGQKLIEELHKRRMEINTKEDEDKKSEEDRQKAAKKSEDEKKNAQESILNRQSIDKATMPRLSDEDIVALFDEYGLPAPDPEWARNHLPNDPKEIRVMLKMQRKMADDIFKKESKNTVNKIPETPKMGAAVPQQSAPMMGMGGPTSPVGMQEGMMGENPQSTTPFFVGDNALIKITNPQNPNSGTLWLADKKQKVLRPIKSEKMLETMFEDPEEAMQSILTLSSQALGPGGVLEGFTPVGQDKGMQDDGSMPNIEFSPAQLKNHYGKAEDPDAENRALSILDGIVGHLNQ